MVLEKHDGDGISFHDSPGKAKESNWLPSPSGKFVLMLRTYWFKETLLDGTWKPRTVEQVN